MAIGRRVRKLANGFSAADSSQQILIADGACDQSLITSAWTVLQETGRQIMMTGAFAGRNTGEYFPIVDAACKLIDESGNPYVGIIREALYDSNPTQVESLLSCHQSMSNRDNGIDDRARCEFDIHRKPGKQAARFGSSVLPFHFDGSKCFFEVEVLAPGELESLPRVYLTHSEHCSKPYEPPTRANTVRATGAQKRSKSFMPAWKYRLGFVPDEVVTKTLQATTQMVPTVEAETREYMRDHLLTRLPELKVSRVNDTCCVDTFFSSIASIRGYTCWLQYSYRDSGLDVVFPMRRRNQYFDTLPKLITQCGAPVTMHSDNAPEFKSKRWASYLSVRQVDQSFTEPHHPNQNVCERRGGVLKAIVTHILHVTQADLRYWCYCLEYVALLQSVTARRKLGWRTPHERHFGNTPDISAFRFIFWQPVWYYAPKSSFPHSKMLPGRFLGIAPATGDAFCFLVLTELSDGRTGTLQVLARSVVRRRHPREEAPIVEEKPGSYKLTFFKSDGKTPLETPTSDADLNLSDFVSEEPEPAPTALYGEPEPVDDDPLRDAIQEVYGPPRKRARIALDVSEDSVAPKDPPTPPKAAGVVPPPSSLTSSTASPPASAPASVAAAPAPSVATEVESTAVPPVTTPGSTNDDSRKPAPRAPDDQRSPPVVVMQPDDDLEDDQSVIADVNDHFDSMAEECEDDDMFDKIAEHEWTDGELMFGILWKTGEISYQPFSLVKRDYPLAAADYILEHKVGTSGSSRHVTGRYSRWARNFRRSVNVAVRRVLRAARGAPMNLPTGHHIQISDEPFGPDENSCLVRRTIRIKPDSSGKRQPIPQAGRKRKKAGRIRRGQPTIKFGVEVPRNVKHAYELDAENGDNLWREATEKEIASLLSLGCFDFRGPDYKPDEEYQFAKLTLVYDVKQDGTRKARLVAGGHTVDPRGISSRSTVVKGISVRLLDIIAHRDNLKTLCGDVGNAFVTADCLEKIYSVAGPEFGERQDSVCLFVKALYGLRSSSRAFRAHFADFLRQMGFVPTRYDRDVWMRLREERDGYDYICTHVDDFKIVARLPERWLEQIASVFLLKECGAPSYYLGNDYNWSKGENAWVTGCATYLKECIRRLENDDLIDGIILEKKIPLPEKVHPELDTSPLLDEAGTRKYQMLIGMAQWACTIGRLDISFACSSLSRFTAAPRLGHLELAIHLFGYLKRYLNRRLVMTSDDLEIDEELKTESFHPDFLEDYDVEPEELDPHAPEAFGRELQTSVFFDADHAHDQKTRRSITGIIVFVGSTPVLWSSKRQGCIASSTYSAEFVAMRIAVEEAIAIRYMLRCLGIPVKAPTNLYGDNFSTIQNANLPDAVLKKKHIAIAFHCVREAIARKIVNAIWVKSHENFSDICTKALGSNAHSALANALMC